MRYDREPLLDHLARSYALGTLSRRVRKRFERVLTTSAPARMAVQQWQARLAPLADGLPEKAPPPRLWSKIAAQTVELAPAVLNPATKAQPVHQESGRLQRWFSFGNLGLLATGAALAFAVFTVVPIVERWNQTAPPTMSGLPASYVAVMSGSDNQAAFLVSSPRHGKVLAIKALRAISVSDAEQLRLWALPAGGTPQSLGVVPASGKSTLTMSDTAEVTLGKIPFLAVSVEPRGTQVAVLPDHFRFLGPCVKLW